LVRGNQPNFTDLSSSTDRLETSGQDPQLGILRIKKPKAFIKDLTIMLNKRAILSLLLAVVAVILISCGGANNNTPPPTYSSEQIEQIERAAIPVRQARKRLTELESLVKQERWSDAFSLLHGPLGGLRREMTYVTRNLLPQDQEPARNYAKQLFQDLEAVDSAVEKEDYSRALQSYDRALNDFDQYLNLLPEAESSKTT